MKREYPAVVKALFWFLAPPTCTSVLGNGTPTEPIFTGFPWTLHRQANVVSVIPKPK